MLEWLTWFEIIVAVLAGALCVILGLLGRKPSDLTMGATGVVALLLIVQLGVAIASPIMGNEPSGSLFEFYLYLVTAIFVPVGAGFWGLLERSRWSTVVLGAANLAVAVMLVRMSVIWFIQGQ
jgi:amino acid transporter